MTNTHVADLVAVNECVEVIDELYDSVLARKARQEIAALTPASAEPVDDTSLQFRIGEIGNQIHNIACEYQDDDELSERLRELRGRLWSIAAEMSHSAPVTVEAAAQVLLDSVTREGSMGLVYAAFDDAGCEWDEVDEALRALSGEKS